MESLAEKSVSVLSPQVFALLKEQPKALLFDLDGTLIDSVPDLAAAIDVMLTSVGRQPAGVDKVVRWVGNGAPALVKRALADDDDGDLIDFADDEFNQAYQIFEFAYAKRLHEATGLYPGVVETLARLSDFKLALITNKPRQFTLPLLESLQITHYFQCIICGDDYERKKPDPMPVIEALKSLRVSAEQALMVGDSVSDIKAAQGAGVATVAMTYGYNHGVAIKEAQSKAGLYLDEFAGLLDAI